MRLPHEDSLADTERSYYEQTIRDLKLAHEDMYAAAALTGLLGSMPFTETGRLDDPDQRRLIAVRCRAMGKAMLEARQS